MLDLNALKAAQGELDKHIIERNKLHGKDLLKDKIAALLVEIGELANETRCFKFWSQKGPSEKEVILEEYVDGLHFILSLTNDLDVLPEHCGPIIEKSLTEQFLALYDAASMLSVSMVPTRLITILRLYIGLANMLGISDDEVEYAYMKKNQKNHQRQESDY